MKLSHIHAAAAIIVLASICFFWGASITVELWGSHYLIYKVKYGILVCMYYFIPTVIFTGITGHILAKRRRTNKLIASKNKRMNLIALNGLLILLPSALFLYYQAAAQKLNFMFYSIQLIELIAGLVNINLIIKNMRDGLKLRKSTEN